MKHIRAKYGDVAVTHVAAGNHTKIEIPYFAATEGAGIARLYLDRAETEALIAELNECLKRMEK